MLKLLPSMRVTFFIFLLLILFLPSFAQDFNHYQPLANSGDIPIEYISEAALIGYDDLTPATNSDTYAEQKSKLDFIRFSDFYIRYLLRSGDLMFGDPLTAYVNRVADILLKDFPELREKFRFYVARYPEVNAACLPNGIVIVNIGLIAQLENEAQLGFALAHEIVHYVRKHGVDAFIEANRIKRNSSDLRSYSKDERIFAMLQYQKDQEFEADELGFLDYYLNSGYKLSEAESMSDVLLYSDFPIDEVRFANENIEDEWFVLPQKYWKDTVDVITAIEDFDDSKMTHPNIKKRRENIQGLLKSYPNKGAEFIQPKEDFVNLRDIARFELCNLLLVQQQYVDVIYLVNVLEQKYPGSEYLQKSKAKAWYGLAKLVHEKQTRKAIRSANKLKGESQRLFFMMKSLSNNELTIVACRELWKVHQSLPTDTIVFEMTEQAFSFLLSNAKYRNTYFTFVIPESDTTVEKIPIDSAVELSKYDKIKQTQNKVENIELFQMAFLQFAQQDDFLKFFTRVRSEATSPVSGDTKYTSSRMRKHEIFKDPDFTSPERILVLDPLYFRVSSSRKAGDRFLSTLKYEQLFIEAVDKQANTNGIKCTVLDAGCFNEADADKYNDMQLLKDWMNESNESDSVFTISCNQDRLNDLAERYNTNYIAITGVLAERTRRDGYIAVYAALFPPLLPFAIAYALSPKFETLYFFEIYDVTSNKKVYSEIRLIPGRDYKVALSQMIFSTFTQLKGR